MTSNQIAYYNAKEGKRHNLATEDETNRSNLAREKEMYRHNVATENETNRHNVANETETHRANMANEELTRQRDWRNFMQQLWQRQFSERELRVNAQLAEERNEIASYQARNQQLQAETQRYAQVRNYELGVRNLTQQEYLTERQLAIAQLNANTASYNASINAMNAETAAYQAQTSRSRVINQNYVDNAMLNVNASVKEAQRNLINQQATAVKHQVVVGYLNAGANIANASARVVGNVRRNNNYGKTGTETGQQEWSERFWEAIDKELSAQE